VPNVPSRTPKPSAQRTSRTSSRALRLGGLAAFALLASGCTGEAAKWKRGGWPSPVTDRGTSVLNLWEGSLLASLIVGGLVIAMIVYCAVRFHRRSVDQIPRQVRYNLPIEVLYTFLPIVVVAVLFYFTAIGETHENDINNRPALQIDVVGFQWSWQFNYVNHGLSITGRPGQPPELVVPVGEQLHFHLSSPDVIHSFWVVPFLFKRDVIPGKRNDFELTVTKPGLFSGRCTEFCGVHHDRMTFSVRAMPQARYDAWLAHAQQVAKAGTNAVLSVYTGPQPSGANL
jgi:cytochrome c oxidase subunit 2